MRIEGIKGISFEGVGEDRHGGLLEAVHTAQATRASMRRAVGGTRRASRLEQLLWLGEVLDSEPDLGNVVLVPDELRPLATNNTYDDATWSPIWPHLLASVGEAQRKWGVTGSEVIIGHPDTGYTRHPAITTNLLLEHATNFYDPEHNPSGHDDLASFFGGHGTSTASIMVGSYPREHRQPWMEPIAQGARVLPVRVTDNVCLFRPSARRALAQGVRWASSHGAHIISISLGSTVAGPVLAAVRAAISQGIIVVAAAGQYWKTVAIPAAIPGVLAVAGHTARTGVWRHSARGPAVSLTGPAVGIWRASWLDGTERHGNAMIARSEGTSHATAATAAVAALWLERHADALSKYPGARRVALFHLVIERCGLPLPVDHSRAYGAGRLCANAILAYDLKEIKGSDIEGRLATWGLQ